MAPPAMPVTASVTKLHICVCGISFLSPPDLHNEREANFKTAKSTDGKLRSQYLPIQGQFQYFKSN